LRTGPHEVTAKRASKAAKSTRVFGQPQKAPKMFRVGLYTRVSTHDQQTLPLQMRAMREYAAKRDWTIAVQIKEVGSGAADANSVKSSSPRRGAVRSMWCWSGDWTAGAGHLSIW
jgi:predicted site-specific integrase-resolvase